MSVVAPITGQIGSRYRKVRLLRQSEPLQLLRSRYLELIRDHDIPHADNIQKTNDWLNYIYYGCLVRELVPDSSARVIDWGGLYGHVTMILRCLGFQEVFNYLLHPIPFYSLFQEQFKIPTLWGHDPNRLALEDQSVDVFISSGVLEHVREDGIGDEKKILADIFRVLKPGGLFFIWNLPAKLGTSELLAACGGGWRHRVRYWQKDIVGLLRQADLEIIYLDKHKFLPGSLMAALAKKIDSLLLTQWDHLLSRVFPFSVLARDFGIVARRIGVTH
jgi:SAM-dependent methyltransferase